MSLARVRPTPGLVRVRENRRGLVGAGTDAFNEDVYE
jgi:hypothetical protein